MKTPLGRAVAARVSALPDAEVHDREGETAAGIRAAVVQAMADHRCDHYTRRPGIAPLCRYVASRLEEAGFSVDSDDGVVISGGAAETRFVALCTLAADRVLHIPADASAPYRSGALLAGATVRAYGRQDPFAGADGIWVWRPDVPVEWRAVNANAVVIADLIDAAQAVPDLAGLRSGIGAAGDQLLLLGSFGVDGGLEAWNVAWFAGPKPLVATVRTLKQAMTICTNAPGQYAALASVERN